MKTIEITVNAGKEMKEQGDLFGLFFEDINHSADGGLYGELVRNRSFEFDVQDAPDYNGFTAWEEIQRGNSVARAHVETDLPLHPKNPHYLRLEVMTSGAGGGIRNLGYDRGICVEKGKKYRFSCWYRRKSAQTAFVRVCLEDRTGQKCYAAQKWEAKKEEWSYVECCLTAEDTDYEARLALLLDTPSEMDLDMISLFPEDTFLGRRNGMRRDIADMLAEMKPAFVRFPGGCLTHIGSLNASDRCSIYRWKNTVGPLESRPSRRNPCNYNQSLGLGFYEYFQFCEDIGAEPLPVMAAGYDPHSLRAVPMEQMQEWIDDALDLIEFANGDTNTKWGAVRAQLGHPESFGLKYLAIGNEETGDAYFERYEVMLQAIKEKYPQIQVINSAGPGSGGSAFEQGWSQARRTETSYVDEHFYQCPEWFIANADRYESYPSEGPGVFLGEYAAKDDAWFNALAEAAFMTGLEKAPAMKLACYAPLLANVAYKNWHPDLIYFNNHQVYGSPSYYVQKLFMTNQGEKLLEANSDLRKREREYPVLKGKCRLRTENAAVDFCNIRIVNEDTGETHMFDAFSLTEQTKIRELEEIVWENYSISFSFWKKNGGTAANLKGSHSFILDYALKDEDNCLSLEIDGWGSQTSLRGKYKGSICDMGLYQLFMQIGTVYECRLEVHGADVKVYLDGKLLGGHTCRMPRTEELYYSAVKEEDGSVIIKLVNLEETSKMAELRLEGRTDETAEVKIWTMSGLPGDKNSFEEPQKVAPILENGLMKENRFSYEIGPYTFAVLRIEGV